MTALFFDITTSLCWGGAPVGITRVEREIARRAPGRASHKMRYCFFHQATQTYYEIAPALAVDVLNGECWIQLEDLRALTLDKRTLSRDAVVEFDADRTNAETLLALHERLETMPLAELLDLRENSPLIAVHYGSTRRFITVRQLVVGPVPMKASTWIINGGLDWEHKNLRTIRQNKKKSGFKYVAIIYDIIPLLMPQYVVPFYVNLLQRYFGELFWTADYGLCISETTRLDVQARMDEWRMPALPMQSWPLGCDIEETAGETARLPSVLNGKRYLLYVSTIEPRKSHRTIIDAFEHGIVNGTIPDDAVCVFVGRIGWNIDNLVQEIQTNPVLTDRVQIMSGIPDADLVELYRQARFVVFPSKYEGYGLSLVEAMALGKACISGDAGSLTEVGGDAPLYISPIDLAKWTEALAKAFTDDAMIARLEKKSRTQYVPVTWDDSADLFYGALNRWVEEAA